MSHDEDVNDKTSVIPSDTFRIRMTEAGKAPPSIVLLVGPGEVGKQWFLEKANTVIGRASDADITVDDRSLSKRHISLVLNGSHVSVIDLKSTNGTEVAGKKITFPTLK